MQIHVSAPEDTILMKLKWAADSGGSQKQFSDALHVFELQRHLLNRSYIDSWATRLNILDLWTQLQRSAEP